VFVTLLSIFRSSSHPKRPLPPPVTKTERGNGSGHLNKVQLRTRRGEELSSMIYTELPVACQEHYFSSFFGEHHPFFMCSVQCRIPKR